MKGLFWWMSLFNLPFLAAIILQLNSNPCGGYSLYASIPLFLLFGVIVAASLVIDLPGSGPAG